MSEKFVQLFDQYLTFVDLGERNHAEKGTRVQAFAVAVTVCLSSPPVRSKNRIAPGVNRPTIPCNGFILTHKESNI